MGFTYAARRIKRRRQSPDLKALQDADYPEGPIVTELLRARLTPDSTHEFVPGHVHLLWVTHISPTLDATVLRDEDGADTRMRLMYGYLSARRIMGHEIRHRPDDDFGLVEPMWRIYQDWSSAEMVGSQGRTAVESGARLAQSLQPKIGLAEPQYFVPIAVAQILAAAEADAKRPGSSR